MSTRNLALPQALTREALAPLRGEALRLVETGGELALDGGRVQHLDASGLQWLLALVRTARELGTTVRPRWSKPARDLLLQAGASSLLEGAP